MNSVQSDQSVLSMCLLLGGGETTWFILLDLLNLLNSFEINIMLWNSKRTENGIYLETSLSMQLRDSVLEMSFSF